ncbi:MAG: hypothetical protein JSV76_05645 [Candidatus Bathyarchaeota archaeon]|nr:MAG: hypothetical protein JSV76_05645 [Candidatus Bathyarchaeota archaeon]
MRGEKLVFDLLSLNMVICTCFVFTQCVSNPTSPVSRAPSQLTLAERKMVESDNQFGFKLFRKIVQEEDNKNIFISPLSVSI